MIIEQIHLTIPILIGTAPSTQNGNIDPSGSDVIMLITYILMALGFSFLCSVAEAVLLSMTPSYIESLKDKKPGLAKTLKRLKQDEVDRSLAAILTLNTIAHTVGAIGSGAKATIVFGSSFFGIFSALMTLMILFLSEIIPKTLGAVYWRSLCLPTAVFVKTLILVLYPLIYVSEKLTRLVAPEKGQHTFSRREIVAMAQAGQKAGVLAEDESRVIRNLFRLRHLRAEDIMTPRTVITALKNDLTVSEALEQVSDSAFSRIPVFSNDLDDISGKVLRTELLLEQTEGNGDKKIKELVRPLAHITHVTTLSQTLETFLRDRIHLALVVDEYGGTDGIVTLEDVVETLLGMEIVDEHDSIEDLRKLARELWQKRK